MPVFVVYLTARRKAGRKGSPYETGNNNSADPTLSYRLGGFRQGFRNKATGLRTNIKVAFAVATP